MTLTSLLLYWSEHFLQEDDPRAPLCEAFPRYTEAAGRLVFSPPAESPLARLVLTLREGEAERLTIELLQPIRVSWAALQEGTGEISTLYSVAPHAAPLYRISLRQARSGYLLLETTPEELPAARLQRAVLVRFPERELGGALFHQEALLQLLVAFQASDFNLPRLYHWFGGPQQEDDEGAQLLPYQGINVYLASCQREADDPSRVSRVDLHLYQPIEVTRAFFAKKMLSLSGPDEAMLSADPPAYVYRAAGNNVELSLTVDGPWEQDSQRVRSLILCKVSRWQRPAEQAQSAPTMRRGAVATQPAIDLGKLPPIESPSSLSPRKANSTEEFSRADIARAQLELEQTRDASKASVAVVAPPRLVAVYKGKSYSLEPEEFIIGRGKQSHLEIPDPDLSRKHASIKRQGERYYIEDHSINGVRHQGIKIKRKEIKPGDSFMLCEHEIQFVLERPKEGA